MSSEQESGISSLTIKPSSTLVQLISPPIFSISVLDIYNPNPVRRRFDFLPDDTLATFYSSIPILWRFYIVSLLTTHFHLITLTILF